MVPKLGLNPNKVLGDTPNQGTGGSPLNLGENSGGGLVGSTASTDGSEFCGGANSSNSASEGENSSYPTCSPPGSIFTMPVVVDAGTMGVQSSPTEDKDHRRGTQVYSSNLPMLSAEGLNIPGSDPESGNSSTGLLSPTDSSGGNQFPGSPDGSRVRLRRRTQGTPIINGPSFSNCLDGVGERRNSEGEEISPSFPLSPTTEHSDYDPATGRRRSSFAPPTVRDSGSSQPGPDGSALFLSTTKNFATAYASAFKSAFGDLIGAPQRIVRRRSTLPDSVPHTPTTPGDGGMSAKKEDSGSPGPNLTAEQLRDQLLLYDHDDMTTSDKFQSYGLEKVCEFLCGAHQMMRKWAKATRSLEEEAQMEVHVQHQREREQRRKQQQQESQLQTAKTQVCGSAAESSNPTAALRLEGSGPGERQTTDVPMASTVFSPGGTQTTIDVNYGIQKTADTHDNAPPGLSGFLHLVPVRGEEDHRSSPPQRSSPPPRGHLSGSPPPLDSKEVSLSAMNSASDFTRQGSLIIPMSFHDRRDKESPRHGPGGSSHHHGSGAQFQNVQMSWKHLAQSKTFQRYVMSASHQQHAPGHLNGSTQNHPSIGDVGGGPDSAPSFGGMTHTSSSAFHPGMSTMSNRNGKSVVVTTKVELEEDQYGMMMINEYLELDDLGRGSFGEVKLGCNTLTEDMVAIKIINRPKAANRLPGPDGKVLPNPAQVALQREIAVMKKLRHKNLVALYEVIDDPEDNKLYLMMQYIDDGPISTAIGNNGDCETIPADELAEYANQICTGLQYLHNHGIIHRDIKPDNILKNKEKHCFLVDFGVAEMTGGSAHGKDPLGEGTNEGTIQAEATPSPVLLTSDNSVKNSSQHIDPRESSVANSADPRSPITEGSDTAAKIQVGGRVGTFPFLAPELFNNDLVDGAAVDIWALGVTFYMLLFGRLPFVTEEEIRTKELVLPVDAVDGEADGASPQTIGSGWRELLMGMLNKEPEQRPSLVLIRNRIKGLVRAVEAKARRKITQVKPTEMDNAFSSIRIKKRGNLAASMSSQAGGGISGVANSLVSAGRQGSGPYGYHAGSLTNSPETPGSHRGSRVKPGSGRSPKLRIAEGTESAPLGIRTEKSEEFELPEAAHTTGGQSHGKSSPSTSSIGAGGNSPSRQSSEGRVGRKFSSTPRSRRDTVSPSGALRSERSVTLGTPGTTFVPKPLESSHHAVQQPE